jgi:lipopolysaccharide/colanic/teichoic acid biosynthesis glycosyltransferase
LEITEQQEVVPAQRLHVMFFNRSYHPDVTASGQLLTELAEDLAQQHGHRVSVVAGPPLSAPAGEKVFRQEARNGVEIHRVLGTRFGRRRFLGRVTNYLSYFSGACVAALRLDRPDVVVAFTDPPIIGLAANLARWRGKGCLTLAVNDVYPEAARLLEGFRSPLVEAALEGVNRFLMRRADRVVALSEAMRGRLVEDKGADPDRTVVIAPWADCEAITPARRDGPFSQAHGLSGKFVVMHSGNIGLSQGLEVLVEAAERLAAHPDVVVLFVGDGVKRRDLEDEVRSRGLSNVRFLPFQSKERLRESFAAADVFVVSLKRGLAGVIVPSKLAGILAAGRPYVAAVEEGCEVTLVTRRHECGLVVEPDDPEDLARKILSLYQNPELAERMGARARQAAWLFHRAVQTRAYHALLLDQVKAAFRPPRHWWVKRPFDVLVSAVGLALSAPAWLLLALAIKLEDGGPVFYAQERVGRRGVHFRSLKFRSMIADSDRRFGPLQARSGDKRVTRVGRVIRVTGLDELPQLWSIFRGDMSWVGPRALLPEEIEVKGSGERVRLRDVPGFEARHAVRPGLTGLAQVFAPRDVTRRNKFRYDLLYIRRWSFWLDVKLFVLSCWISVRGRWEHRGRKV